MSEDAVFEAVHRLVAAGEYLDVIPGIPGARLTGGGVFDDNRRLYRRGSREHLEARKAGLVERLPPLSPASAEAVEEVEELLAHPLPGLLRRLYLEIGNGGFGPGYGILGVRGGHGDDDGKTALDLYRDAHSGSFEAWRSVPAGLLPICSWGCGIYSFVDCGDPTARMWAWDANPVPPDDLEKALFRDDVGLTEWLARWVEMRLPQPALVHDAETGEWRGATEQEYAEWAADEP